MFPFSRPEILNKWIHNVGKKGWMPTKSSVLCSDHFEKSCFVNDGKNICLKRDAVPTIFDLSLRRKVPNKLSRKKFPIKHSNNTATNSTLMTEKLVLANAAQSKTITTSPHIIKCNGNAENGIPSGITVDESVIKCEETSTDGPSKQLFEIQNIRSLNDQMTLQSMAITSNNNLLIDETKVNDKLISSTGAYFLRSSGTIPNCEETLNGLYMLPTSNASSKTSLDDKIFVAKKKFESISKLKLKYVKELKTKQQKIRRLNKTVNKMQKKIDELELKNSLPTLLHEHFSGFHFDFILKLLTAKKSTRQMFAESIRKFAFVLYAFSPRAYKHMQLQFKNALPHHTQVREWHRIERNRALSEKMKLSLQGTDELQSKNNCSDIKNVDDLQSKDNDVNIESTDKMQSKDEDNNIKITDEFQAIDNYIANDAEGECLIVEYTIENYSEGHTQNNISYNSNDIQSAVHYIISEDQEFYSETNGS